MKFFKDKFLVRGLGGKSRDLWQRAIVRYNDHIKSIRSQLPSSVVHFHGRIELHDLVFTEVEFLDHKKLRIRIQYLDLYFWDY